MCYPQKTTMNITNAIIAISDKTMDNIRFFRFLALNEMLNINMIICNI